MVLWKYSRNIWIFQDDKKRSNKEMTDEDFYKYVLMSMYEDIQKTIFVL